ncbi:DUF4276 family protein [Allonocardiopsis opalescens]|uniref:Uncharacterized protein DUF4276 n=1 Tax=Allonocardiopsis opalescens TaxID=1144618 RepID=A0A2T0QDX7_9ACTN|nr:DUF4276 family protein [Allonocardiopsis opalescens]PRY02129.1 uncharacterized protein DUF4276 [Allonocardiopsis opalescens]
MTRLLIPGLLAEGASDELFLGRVIVRQLRRSTQASARCEVDVGDVALSDLHTVADGERVAQAAAELAAECHVLFVHHDHRERGKADRLLERLTELGVGCPAVPLIPKRETEAWLLADPAAWTGIGGANRQLLPARSADAERVHDPKALLERIVPRRRAVDECLELLGETTDLEVLDRLPAYRAWVERT